VSESIDDVGGNKLETIRKFASGDTAGRRGAHTPSGQRHYRSPPVERTQLAEDLDELRTRYVARGERVEDLKERLEKRDERVDALEEHDQRGAGRRQTANNYTR